MSCLVSVIIPVHNRPAELHRAISSVLAQTIQDFEIFVVDDCSEINLSEVVSQFNDSRIRYFKFDKKGNANVCRNYGINHAKGEYIAMLDSDDEWLRSHLQGRLEYLRAKNADGVFGSYRIKNGGETREVISRPVTENEGMVNYILSDGFVATPTHFYKASCAKKIMWDESLERHQDYDFSVRFAESYRFVSSTEITCIVHWEKNERRNEHFPSMMKFIEKYKKEIDPKLYCQYHRRIYTSIKNRPELDKNIKRHYMKNSIKYMAVLSLTDYMSTFGINKPLIYRFFLRIEYSLKVLVA